MDRYLCIHCHFYQPPRENPWLEIIELQESAYPYHDWNERITAECYAPNAASRILTPDNRITRIVNNYSRISFNVGPTLLSWMANRAPETYQAILDADRESQQRFSGHGSAIAQVYNHMIMPLANRRDKQTQVVWGIRDFEYRFDRAPEGMWLAETAVDIETLEVLAANGIQFTILAPSQAKQERRVTTVKFKNVEGGKIDPTRPYVCNLPSGRSINLFFYDGPISRAVAFEGLLSDGERFANRLISGFAENRRWPQLMHIATDGETYGHHHYKGEMALSYALHHIETKKLAKLTNYGEYLTINPPTHEVEIVENTAWSCSHGVGRWNTDCGCNSGGKPGWNQSWRAPLRKALDHLRDSLIEPYETKACGTAARSLAGARRVRQLRARPRRGQPRQVPRHPRPPRPVGSRNGHRAVAARNAAPRHADVHQLRLVLRRAVGHRNRAGHHVRRTRPATGPEALPRPSRADLSRAAAVGQKQPPRIRRRRADLRPVREARAG